MKKLLAILTMSIILLSPFNVLGCNNNQYNYIARVTSVNLQDGIYYTSLIDLQGEEWILEAHNDLSNKWLYIHSDNMGTSYLYDDEITGFEILED